MKHIVILIPRLSNVSPINAAICLAKGLAEEKRVTIFSIGGISDDFELENKISNNVRIKSLSGGLFDIFALRYFFSFLSLVIYVWKHGATHVISFLFLSDVYAAFLKVLAPNLYLISSQRNMYADEYRISFGRMGALYSYIQRMSLRKFDKIVAMSHEMYNFLLSEKIAKDRLTLIPNFLDESRVKKYLSQPAHSYDQQCLNFIYIGALIKRKRVEIFLESAFEVFRTKRKFFHIYLIGEGPDKSRLASLVPEQYSQYVHFLGFQDNTISFLLNADFFVLPSLSEGVSRAALEALYCNCRCILSDIKGNEIFKTVRNGVYFFGSKADLVRILAGAEKTDIDVDFPAVFTEKYGIARYSSLID